MANILKKSAKPITYTMVILAGIIMVIALVFMTNYRYLRIETSVDSTTGELILNQDDLLKWKFPKVDSGETHLVYDPLFDEYVEETLYVDDPVFQLVYDFNQDLQSVNEGLLGLSITLALCFAALCIVANGSRRKYYISNALVGVVTSLIASIYSIVLISKVGSIFGTYNGSTDGLSNKEKIDTFYSIMEHKVTTQEALDSVDCGLSMFTLNITQVFLVLIIIYAIINAVYVIMRLSLTFSKGGKA